MTRKQEALILGHIWFAVAVLTPNVFVKIIYGTMALFAAYIHYKENLIKDTK